MSVIVYRTLTILCELVQDFPIGTNLGLWHVLLALLSGQLLLTRGALIPALYQLGLSIPAVRRAWAAFAYGDWCIAQLLQRWQTIVTREGRWHARQHGGYRPVVLDLTGFFRPHLQACPSKHFDGRAGKALPAIPLALIAAVGSIDQQRLALPRACVPLRATDKSEQCLQSRALREAAQVLASDEVLLLDAGFHIAEVQSANVSRYVLRGALNFTAQRAQPPAYKGRGRRPIKGERVRPLPRQHKGKTIAATPPDHVEIWQAAGYTLRAEWSYDLQRPRAPMGVPTFHVVVIHDPRYHKPLLLITNLRTTGALLRDLYADRWPIEQLPQTAKQLIGAERQWVSAVESRLRLPALSLFTGHVLSYLAATQPAVPSGFWDRNPRRTPGRLRRALARADFFKDFTLPTRMREKRSPTEHLPKGFNAHQREPFAHAQQK